MSRRQFWTILDNSGQFRAIFAQGDGERAASQFLPRRRQFFSLASFLSFLGATETDDAIENGYWRSFITDNWPLEMGRETEKKETKRREKREEREMSFEACQKKGRAKRRTRRHEVIASRARTLLERIACREIIANISQSLGQIICSSLFSLCSFLPFSMIFDYIFCCS